MYCDTDFLIYIRPRDEPQLIEKGENLGDMTSELRPLETKSEFVSVVPNTYAYRVLDTVTGDGRTVSKVRGINVN